jgi:hypothetical protein
LSTLSGIALYETRVTSGAALGRSARPIVLPATSKTTVSAEVRPFSRSKRRVL